MALKVKNNPCFPLLCQSFVVTLHTVTSKEYKNNEQQEKSTPKSQRGGQVEV